MRIPAERILGTASAKFSSLNIYYRCMLRALYCSVDSFSAIKHSPFSPYDETFGDYTTQKAAANLESENSVMLFTRFLLAPTRFDIIVSKRCSPHLSILLESKLPHGSMMLKWSKKPNRFN